MAPLPPFITRLVATYLATALTRRLQQSPTFFRVVDRLVHEADHLPLRLQGKPVPPYRSIDPHEPTIREMAEDAWQRKVDDPGEPHDMPDPFKQQRQQNQASGNSNTSGHSAPPTFDEARAARQRMSHERQRERAREALRAAQQGRPTAAGPAPRAQSQASSSSSQSSSSPPPPRDNQPMNDLRALLDKMREEQAQRIDENGDRPRANDPRQER